ncbi:hypothetical protein D6D15_06065 [Aureobasidium pullulans]|uniref:BTB domain-containing protein n=1 Tax=Aureobasidium pullulans TaxID=5580 RepID=A0A4V4IV77_AURPU|nr:hypothetical protein D6D15_06065 [Aureobasidium pullulans]
MSLNTVYHVFYSWSIYFFTYEQRQSQPQQVLTHTLEGRFCSIQKTNSCFGSIVTVEVGPERSFAIHKDLLCFYSDYFRAAFNGSFKEAAEGKISLPDCDAQIFYIFNGFLYTRELCSEAGKTGHELSSTTLSELWVFGDVHLVPALQNLAIDCLIGRIQTLGSLLNTKIPYIYRRTVAGSPLRRMAVDWEVCSPSVTEDNLSCWPRIGLIELAIPLSSKQAEHRSFRTLLQSRGKCYYHVHSEGEHC